MKVRSDLSPWIQELDKRNDVQTARRVSGIRFQLFAAINQPLRQSISYSHRDETFILKCNRSIYTKNVYRHSCMGGGNA